MPTPPLPYEHLDPVPSFTVTSSSVTDSEPMSNDFSGGGGNQSPQLAWSGFPAETKSFAVTCFDPDAPTGSGFWHWVLFDIPASVTELAAGAASGDLAGVPAGAIHAGNDAGSREYVGPFPPAGHGPHRYAFTVHALGVERLGPDENASPAFVGFNIWHNVIGRGLIVPTYEITG